MPILLTPQQVVDTHRPLLRLIVEALRRGTLHAQAYANWQDEPIDRALAPSHVRKGARRYLIETGQDVQNEEDIDYEAEFLSNLGLLIAATGIQMRVLRSVQGDQLPAPGHSYTRQQFYQQDLWDLMGDQEPPLGETVPAITRLVLHWSTDSEYNLDKVYLACPRAGEVTRSSVQAHWDWPIWRRHGASIDGQVQAEVTDLEIYLNDVATGSEG